MTDTPISNIYTLVTEAHANIQRDFSDIDPVVGIITKMRTVGIQADAMTIDCLKTGKRILLVCQDEQPDVVNYQFCLREEDPADEFEIIPLKSVTTKQLYDWMRENFERN
ncbi:MAG: hypothetical protein R8M46_09045 [Ghiorsea sp.]